MSAHQGTIKHLNLDHLLALMKMERHLLILSIWTQLIFEATPLNKNCSFHCCQATYQM